MALLRKLGPIKSPQARTRNVTNVAILRNGMRACVYCRRAEFSEARSACHLARSGQCEVWLPQGPPLFHAATCFYLQLMLRLLLFPRLCYISHVAKCSSDTHKMSETVTILFFEKKGGVEV
jgi:hypothetical protein